MTLVRSRNRRIYKKQAKRAKHILMTKYGYRPEHFDVVRRDDELGYEMFGHRNAFEPLVGTPILVTHDYYTGEASVDCLLYVLSEIHYWGVSDKQLKRREDDLAF